MRTFSSRSLLLALALAVPLAGCAGRGGLKKGDVPYIARDVGTLYTLAKRRLDQGQYKQAALLFDEVERQHPYSIWARRAQLLRTDRRRHARAEDHQPGDGRAWRARAPLSNDQIRRRRPAQDGPGARSPGGQANGDRPL